MPDPKRINDLSVEDYLVFEDQATLRHEFVRGQIFEMSGSYRRSQCDLRKSVHNFACFLTRKWLPRVYE